MQKNLRVQVIKDLYAEITKSRTGDLSRAIDFLKKARENGNRIENGIFMFIYQANQSFSIWNNIIPKIDEEVLKIFE